MLLPYSASDARRSAFWALLWVAVLGPALVAASCFLPFVPQLALLALFSIIAAITFLCIWCSVSVRDGPRLIRIALVSGAVLFLLLTVAVLLIAIAPPIIDTKETFVRADIQGIRTLLLSYNKTNGHYPSADQGLNALVPKLMEELPRDTWGTPYVYRSPGKRYPDAYDLFSAGPDRVADTADDEWGK